MDVLAASSHTSHITCPIVRRKRLAVYKHLVPLYIPRSTAASIRLVGGAFDIQALVTEVVNGESYNYYPLGQHVVRAVGVCASRPTFKYTRIEIAGVLERLAAGESVEEVVHGFDGRVSREAIEEAVYIMTTSRSKG